jgi:hypothetical protein
MLLLFGRPKPAPVYALIGFGFRQRGAQRTAMRWRLCLATSLALAAYFDGLSALAFVAVGYATLGLISGALINRLCCSLTTTRDRAYRCYASSVMRLA